MLLLLGPAAQGGPESRRQGAAGLAAGQAEGFDRALQAGVQLRDQPFHPASQDPADRGADDPVKRAAEENATALSAGLGLGAAPAGRPNLRVVEN